MELEEFFSLVERSELLNSVAIAKELNAKESKYIKHAVEGITTIEDREIKLLIGIDEHFPNRLPLIFLRTKLGKSIPNQTEKGVCYIRDEGLILNARDPGGIIYDCLEKAIGVLKNSINGDNFYAYLQEFERYGNGNFKEVVFLFTNFSQPFQSFWYHSVDSVTYAWDGFKDVEKFFRYIKLDEVFIRTQKKAGFYIELNETCKTLPFLAGWRGSDILSLINNHISNKKLKRLQRELEKLWSRDVLIIFGLTQQNNQKALFGFFLPCQQILAGIKTLRLSNNEQSDNINSYQPCRVGIRRLSHSYLLPRGGANTDLQTKKVAIIGCGSVGGQIALEMGRSGVGEMLLVDPDNYEPENIYRHILDYNCYFQTKVEALKEKISKMLPYCCIETIDTSIEESLLVPHDVQKLRCQDLIIVATGNPTINLLLNKTAHSDLGYPALIFTWLEAFGLGGHALLTNTKNQSNGCLECLFSGNEYTYEDGFYNKASFAAPNQFFSRSISGCGSQFIPFSALDSSQTAILASRLALDYLLEKEKGHPILSWKGDKTDFEKNGYIVSSRYSQSLTRLQEHRYQYQSNLCPVCSSYV